MSYPADAFVRVTNGRGPDGALVYVRDFWALMTHQHGLHGRVDKNLILTGKDAGAIYGRFSDTGLATAPGVKAEVRIVPEDRIVNGSHTTHSAVVISPEGGLQFWGHLQGSDAHRYGFFLDGSPVAEEEHELAPFVMFTRFQVWLSRDGLLLSDKPLFTVG
ncbi:hypothetical protein [Stenotrophomonas sp.]|uniref:hypothetical protein n=1 Tax=Stenotrophomonas sp. TaxID=69392 RepID=UPI0028AB5F0A|nr:hypothetical protein [Stenotrophomonas sp.]